MQFFFLLKHKKSIFQPYLSHIGFGLFQQQKNHCSASYFFTNMIEINWRILPYHSWFVGQIPRNKSIRLHFYCSSINMSLWFVNWFIIQNPFAKKTTTKQTLFVLSNIINNRLWQRISPLICYFHYQSMLPVFVAVVDSNWNSDACLLVYLKKKKSHIRINLHLDEFNFENWRIYEHYQKNVYLDRIQKEQVKVKRASVSSLLN